MATLSQYWFDNELLGGNFTVYNVGHPAEGWAWIANGGQTQATLAFERPDSETVLDLAAQLNSPDLLALVDKELNGKANRTSGIMAQARFWWQVPYYSQNPGRHGHWDQLVRLYFNFHIGTPWYCSDADGDISYYILVHLDSADHLQAFVDGWSYNYNGGGPFCTGAINDALNAAVPAGIVPLQNALDQKLALLQDVSFSAAYILPGNGTSAGGASQQNADTDAAIAVIS